eukprot:CAMPEP_0177645288 /NCGR_PEP_ID=MMETSP0447-20121125/9170_1 /TAXON_ID=0 /ORGANISM="Stygamoeba regulata, Strain BSH-02190019" /LENGTH=1149 /DNA_ID=CAMNT_0019147763 /DNA_START=35 /DNA_END=3484 /DNA_ORIENTATION=-
MISLTEMGPQERGEYRLRTFFSSKVGRGFISLDPPRSERAVLLAFVAELRRDTTWHVQAYGTNTFAPRVHVVLDRVRPLALRCRDRVEFRNALSGQEPLTLLPAFDAYLDDLRVRVQRQQQQNREASTTSSSSSSSSSSSVAYEQMKQSALAMFSSPPALSKGGPVHDRVCANDELSPAVVLSWPPLTYGPKAANHTQSYKARVLLALCRMNTVISGDDRRSAKQIILAMPHLPSANQMAAWLTQHTKIGAQAANEVQSILLKQQRFTSPRTDRRNQIGEQLRQRLSQLRSSQQAMFNSSSNLTALWQQIVTDASSRPTSEALERAFVQACPQKLSARIPTQCDRTRSASTPSAALPLPSFSSPTWSTRTLKVSLSPANSRNLSFDKNLTAMQIQEKVAREFGLVAQTIVLDAYGNGRLLEKDFGRKYSVSWDLSMLDELRVAVLVSAASLPVRVTESKSATPHYVSYASASLMRLFPVAWKDLLQLMANFSIASLFRQIEAPLRTSVAQKKKIYPPPNQVFAALNLVTPAQVKVVILGQDPYHGPGQAMGLSFSVPAGVKVPPSLRNIFKELMDDGFPDCDVKNGDLTNWAEQGVLLLNTLLTVEEHAPMSHSKLGWDQVTSRLIRALCEHHPHLVFLLWGKPAQSKESLIVGDHLILKSGHPSPMSQKHFFGHHHFSKANAYLQAHGKTPIAWDRHIAKSTSLFSGAVAATPAIASSSGTLPKIDPPSETLTHSSVSRFVHSLKSRFGETPITKESSASLSFFLSMNLTDSSPDGVVVVVTQPGCPAVECSQAVLQSFLPQESKHFSMASFDFDGTLAHPKSGATFAKSPSDWRPFSPNVYLKLQQYHALGMRNVIFTNQLGVAKGRLTVRDVVERLNQFTQAANVPILSFISVASDAFRKPAPGMSLLLRHRLQRLGYQLQTETSFFCGDAAGRSATSHSRKDFSASDLLFAFNSELQFFTPEQLFLDDQTARPAVHLAVQPKIGAYPPPSPRIRSSKPHLVVLVGQPGSGKTIYAQKYFSGFRHINGDTMNRSKMVSEARAALLAGQSVVVDNTNPSAAARAEFVTLAVELGLEAHAITLVLPDEQAEFMNAFRALTSSRDAVPQVAYNVYKKNFSAPSTQEGFSTCQVAVWESNDQSPSFPLAL